VRFVALLVVFAFACSNTRYPETLFALRDPRAIRIDIATPRGPVTVLREGETRSAIPATAPPFMRAPVADVWVERGPDGGIDAWCPSCPIDKRFVLLEGSTLHVRRGPTRFAVQRGELHIDVDCDETVRYQHSKWGTFPVRTPRLTLDFATPIENVTAIDYVERLPDTAKKPPDHTIAWAGGGVLAAFGLAFAAYGLDKHSGAGIGVGLGVIAWGGVLTALDYCCDNDRTDHHHPISLPTSSP